MMDIDLVKRNVGKMIDQGAPETDIDAYLGSEGVSVEQLRAGKEGIGADVAKSAGIGLAKGGIGLGGMLGDIRELAGAAGEKVGLGREAGRRVVTALPGIGPLSVIAPTSGDIQSKVEEVTGEFYKPRTTYGEYAQTGGEFLPAALAGPGGIPRKVATQALIPAAVSETAGQATKDTAAEPYARILGGLAGGVAGGRVAQRGLPSATVTPAQVEARATAGYRSPEVAELRFQPEAMGSLSDRISAALRDAKANSKLAPQTHSIVDDMKPSQPRPSQLERLQAEMNRETIAAKPPKISTYEDFQTTRELLEAQAKNFANPQEQRAATIALKELTNYIDSIPQRDLLAGQAAKASETLKRSRADYAAAKTAERVEEKLFNAELGAASTYSGGNINNKTRQLLRPLLTSKKGGRGLTDDELALIEANVRGSPTGNTARAIGKFLGGGGGMQAFNAMSVGGGTGAFLGGPVGALIGMAAPIAAGQVSRRVGDALTRRKARQIVEAILARAPSGPQQAAENRIARALAQRGLSPLQGGTTGAALAALPLYQ